MQEESKDPEEQPKDPKEEAKDEQMQEENDDDYLPRPVEQEEEPVEPIFVNKAILNDVAPMNYSIETILNKVKVMIKSG